MASDVTAQDGGRAGRGGAAMTIGALLVGALAAGALCLSLTLRVRTLLAGQTGPWRVEAAVEVGVTSVGLLVAAWLAGSGLVATMCLLVRAAGTTWRTGERLVHRFAPQVVRRALVLAVGAGIGLGMASGATAVAPDPSPTISVTADAAALPDLGWAVTVPSAEPHAPTPVPEVDVASAVVTSQEPAATPAAAETAANPESVVVVAGDSLWAIAARHLPSGATDAEVAAAWPRWYDANAEVIGADPDLVRQGQVLTTPAQVGEVAR